MKNNQKIVQPLDKASSFKSVVCFLQQITRIILFILVFFAMPVILYSQDGEMEKFYAQYRPDKNLKSKCDSVYKLIEQRRSAFSNSLKVYKETNGSVENFEYKWTKDEKDILASLKNLINKTLLHLVYYSYFDLGYGSYGLSLKKEICEKAILEIKPSSAIWAMEPSLTDAVIKFAGGEEKYKPFIQKLQTENKNKDLLFYIKCNLSPSRPLKEGKKLPELFYRSLTDTFKIISMRGFAGKYLLIDIWATWCKPCIEEFPVLQNAYNNRSNQLEFLSISIDNEVSSAINFLNKNPGLNWTQAIALKMKDILNNLMITDIPCTILIDPAGKILSYGSELRGEKLEKTLSDKVK